MNLSDISKYDQSFRNLKLKMSEDFTIKGICDRWSLESHHLYFCGAKSFWNSLKEASAQGKLKGVYVVFQTDFQKKVNEELEVTLKDCAGWGTVKNVPLTLSALSKPFYDQEQLAFNDEIDGRKMGTTEIDPTAKIAENVFIGANVKIGAHATIYSGVNILSQCSVGEGSVIYPNITLMPKTRLGKDCRLHSGTVIGSDGFGYNFDEGVHKKLWHMGGVIIEDDVEIGSNCCIDQGTFSATVIGAGSKLDNQVHVAHNVHLGKGSILCGQVAIAGSAIVGDFCVFGGQAGVAPDVKIGAGSQIAGGSGVTGSLDSGSVVGGHPARPLKEWLRGHATLRKLSTKK